MSASKEQLVFLVEDDRFFLELLENYFSTKKNFKTVPFLTGEECIANLHQQPNLVLLDYILSKDTKAIDGNYVYKKIKENCPATKIVVVSGQQSADVVFNLVKDGLHNYVIKDKETFRELDNVLKQYAGI